jgi:hypothetical protein
MSQRKRTRETTRLIRLAEKSTSIRPSRLAPKVAVTKRERIIVQTKKMLRTANVTAI